VLSLQAVLPDWRVSAYANHLFCSICTPWEAKKRFFMGDRLGG
jgi:hypothetical protein